jgi:hypothetical protein
LHVLLSLEVYWPKLIRNDINVIRDLHNLTTSRVLLVDTGERCHPYTDFKHGLLHLLSSLELVSSLNGRICIKTGYFHQLLLIRQQLGSDTWHLKLKTIILKVPLLWKHVQDWMIKREMLLCCVIKNYVCRTMLSAQWINYLHSWVSVLSDERLFKWIRGSNKGEVGTTATLN